MSFGSEVFGVSGTTSNPKTVTISNPKSASELGRIATLSIGGADPGDFAVEDPNGCMGEGLDPGASCVVEVTFTPTSLGAHSSTLTVTDSGGHSANPVHLKGSGVRGALQFPPTLSFGRVQRGTSSAPELVTLSNNNPVALDISSIVVGAGFAASQNCLGILRAGGTCQISVTFSPPAAKNSKPSKVTGALILSEDAAASPQKVQLSAVAVSTNGPYGQVNGGLKPIAVSSVTLFAAGTGYGSGATSLATAATNAGGDFSLPSYTCPAGNPQTYITATGGNPGRGSKTAIGMMALTGPCNSLTSQIFVMVNELTTVAAQWALAQFSDTTGQNFGTSSTNTTGLTNAVNLATNDLVVSYRLVGDPSNTGIPASFWAYNYPNYDGHKQMDTIANILAACVNSAGPSATLPTCAAATTACNILFACTGTPVSGTTLQAAHAMATSPASNVSNIFDAQGLRPSVPFTPYESTAPVAWTLALNFPLGAFPLGIAVDAAGNVWVTNNCPPNFRYCGGSGTIIEFNSSGTAISPDTGYTGGGIDGPIGIAVDAAGNVWVTNFYGYEYYAPRSISELSSSGIAISPSIGYTGGGIDGPISIAVDAAGNVWATNFYEGSGSISELSSSGTAISPDTGYTGGGLEGPNGIAVDAAGDVWVVNGGNSSLSKFNSSGAAISPDTGYTGGGLEGPNGIAVDAAGSVWVVNGGNNSLSEFNSSGAAISPDTGYTGGGLNYPNGIAVDAVDNVWVANEGGNSISELSSSGIAISPSTGYTGGGIDEPTAIAIDAAGDVWVANQSGSGYGYTGSISEFIGLAKPVRTPLVACLKASPPHAVCLP